MTATEPATQAAKRDLVAATIARAQDADYWMDEIRAWEATGFPQDHPTRGPMLVRAVAMPGIRVALERNGPVRACSIRVAAGTHLRPPSTMPSAAGSHGTTWTSSPSTVPATPIGSRRCAACSKHCGARTRTGTTSSSTSPGGGDRSAHGRRVPVGDGSSELLLTVVPTDRLPAVVRPEHRRQELVTARPSMCQG